MNRYKLKYKSELRYIMPTNELQRNNKLLTVILLLHSCDMKSKFIFNFDYCCNIFVQEGQRYAAQMSLLPQE